MNNKTGNYPLVSIITPSYNSYPYIIENIESVTKQDYPNIEHIVIDGGSTDGTVEVLKRYPHLIWISEKDGGQSEAINKGFKLAKGEIIGWLNSDDCYNENAVSNSVRVLLEDKDTDIVHSDQNVINEKSEIFKILKGENVSLEKMLLRNCVRQPTVFFREKVVSTLDGVREDLHYAMDRDFWLRAILAGFKFKYISGLVSANFRYCKGTKSKEMVIEFFKEWTLILRELENRYRGDFEKHKLIINALNFTQSSMFFLESVKSVRKNEYANALNFFFNALNTDKKNFFKLGTWKLLIREILIKFNLKKVT